MLLAANFQRNTNSLVHSTSCLVASISSVTTSCLERFQLLTGPCRLLHRLSETSSSCPTLLFSDTIAGRSLTLVLSLFSLSLAELSGDEKKQKNVPAARS